MRFGGTGPAAGLLGAYRRDAHGPERRDPGFTLASDEHIDAYLLYADAGD
jgi:hypothetical protein